MSAKGEPTKIDGLSELPWAVLDNIHGRLEMKEAVRTSILSRQWRYKWVNLSKLLFDVVSNPALWSCPNTCFEYSVYHVLPSHCGNIQTFKLCTTSSEKFSDHQNWLHYLATNGIRELTLEYGCSKNDNANLFRLPACIWSCQQLNHLQIRQYGLPEPLCAFKGFRNLVSLQLHGKLNDIQLLESLIGYCPVLQRLVLKGLQSLACLSIVAPKLKQLELEGQLGAILLINCPVLAVIAFVIPSDELTSVQYRDQGRIYNLVHYLSHLSSLKCLTISGIFLKTKATLKILKLFSNLQELYILIQSREYSRQSFEFLQAQSQSSYCFDQLRIVKLWLIDSVTDFGYQHSELEFIKFLLTHSPILEKMMIYKDEHRDKPD